MEPWRIGLIVLLVIVLIPTLVVMNQVKREEEQSGGKETERLKCKRNQLKWMQRLLICVFVLALIATMLRAYLPLFQR